MSDRSPANRIGIHSLVWVGGWSAGEASYAIASTREAGFDLIELAAIDPGSFDTGMTAGLLQEYDVAAAVSLGLDEATDVSSEDGEIVKAGRRRLRDALALTRDVGGDYLGGVVYGKLGRYTAPPTPRGRENAVETIALLADDARAAGVTIGLEFCNRYETNLLNTTEQTLEFIDEVGRENVVAHLDTYHMNIEERSFRGAVMAAASANRLGYIHVGESHRGLPGTGSVPWHEFFEALRESAYDGTITFESFSSAIVHPTLSSTLSIWRDLWDDSMALATQARAFLSDHLAGQTS